MSRVPNVVVFYEAGPGSVTDYGQLLLTLATTAWVFARQKTLLVDADPAGRLTRAAEGTKGLLPRTSGERTFEEYLDAAERLDPPPEVVPWKLSRHARYLVPSGGDPLGAHMRALGRVVATGGALHLGDRMEELFNPTELDIALTLVAAPSPNSGLGALLGAQADLLVVVGADEARIAAELPGLANIAHAANPLGPDAVLPLLIGGVKRKVRWPTGPLDRLQLVHLPGELTPEELLPLLLAIAVET